MRNFFLIRGMERKSSGVEELIKTVVLIPLRFIDHPSFPIFIRTYAWRDWDKEARRSRSFFRLKRFTFFPPFVFLRPAIRTRLVALFMHTNVYSLSPLNRKWKRRVYAEPHNRTGWLIVTRRPDAVQFIYLSGR